MCPSKIICPSASISFGSGSSPPGCWGVQDLGDWFWELDMRPTSWWGQLPAQCGSGDDALLLGVCPSGGLIESVSGLPNSLQIYSSPAFVGLRPPRSVIIIQTGFSALRGIPFTSLKNWDCLQHEEQGFFELDLCLSLRAILAKGLSFSASTFLSVKWGSMVKEVLCIENFAWK